MAKQRIHLTESEFRKVLRKMITEAVTEATTPVEFMDRRFFVDDVYGNLLNYVELYLNDEAMYYEGLEDLISEYTNWFVDSKMELMKKCVHMGSVRVEGEVFNIEQDYTDEHNGTDYRKIVSMIDNGISNDQTHEFKIWALDWFWGVYYLFFDLTDGFVDIFKDYLKENYPEDLKVHENRKRNQTLGRNLRESIRPKHRVHLKESDIHRIIKESVRRILANS